MATSTVADGSEHRDIELRREAMTMALYVAICVLAALTATTDHSDERTSRTLALVWGTTAGLALAHWLAFRMSARLARHGRLDRADAEVAGAQLLGALVVAALCTVAALVTPGIDDRDAVRFVCAAFAGGVGYLVARENGASAGRSAVYAGAIATVALTIALIKNWLAGH